MAFNLGGLVQGYQQGQNHTADLRQKAMQLKQYQMMLDQEKQKLVAQAQAGAAGMNGIGGDPSQPPAQGSAPQPPPALPGAGPVPGGPPPQAAPQGSGAPPQGQPAGAAPPMLPGATPMPGAAPPGMTSAPQGGQPAPGGAPQGANPGLSGVARPTGNYNQDQQQTLKALYMSVKKANPNIKPGEAFQAVDALVGQMKGVSAEDKIALQANNDMMRLNFQYTQEADRHQDAEAKLEAMLKTSQDKLDAMQKRLEELNASKEKIAEGANASRERVAGTNAGARIGSAQIGANSRIAVGAGNNAAARDVGAGHDQARITSENMRGASSQNVAETNRMARENAAAIAAGKPPPHPDAPARPGAPPPPKRGQIVNGYRYEPVNVDPHDSKNWVKVQ